MPHFTDEDARMQNGEVSHSKDISAGFMTKSQTLDTAAQWFLILTQYFNGWT